MNLNLEKKDYIYIGIFIILILYIFNISSSIEKMTESTSDDNIRSAIKDVYEVDVKAIRNLGNLAKDILNNKGELKLPYDVKITGNLTTTGDAFIKDGAIKLTKTTEGAGKINLKNRDKSQDCTIRGDHDPNGNTVVIPNNFYIAGQLQTKGTTTLDGVLEMRNNIALNQNALRFKTANDQVHQISVGPDDGVKLKTHGPFNLFSAQNKGVSVTGDINVRNVLATGDINVSNVLATKNIESENGAVVSRYYDIIRAPKSDSYNLSKDTIAYRLQYPDNGNNDILFQGTRADKGKTTGKALVHINIREDGGHM